MPIQFQCPACRQPIEVDDVYAQKEVTCPYCLKMVTAPSFSTLQTPAVTARPLTNVPVAEGSAPPLTMPPRRGVLSLVGFMLTIGCLVLFLVGGMAARGVLEDYAKAKGLNPEDAAVAMQKELMTGKLPPNSGGLIMGTFSICLGLPGYLAGLICSLIACFRPNERQGFAVAGVAIGLVLPMMFLVGIFGALVGR